MYYVLEHRQQQQRGRAKKTRRRRRDPFERRRRRTNSSSRSSSDDDNGVRRCHLSTVVVYLRECRLYVCVSLPPCPCEEEGAFVQDWKGRRRHFLSEKGELLGGREGGGGGLTNERLSNLME